MDRAEMNKSEMIHAETGPGLLRSYLDNELESARRSAVSEHLNHCQSCATELDALRDHAACVHDLFSHLPSLPEPGHSARTWATLESRRDDWASAERPRWTLARTLSLAGGALSIAAVILILTVAPVRAWAENLLSVFRVQRLTVLEIDPNTLNGQRSALLNPAIGHMLSDQVTVTHGSQPPRPIADPARASEIAGFPVQLLPGEPPSRLTLQPGASMTMKLDQDRVQSLLNEAGRSDIQIPSSIDGAVIGVRVPTGITASYGNCGRDGSKTPDDTCVNLIEIPSPVVSAPQQIDPAQIAQVALQLFGMNANDAASFTQTVDWTSTLVLPVVRGKSDYKLVHVNGRDGALLRASGEQQSGRYMLLWVDNGIVFSLDGIGDDTTAVNLAERLQ